jgi:uncharacterized membrane protein YeaQ/YmgE (transglycosylase-associated protein family)
MQMGWLMTLIIGGIVGWLASIVMKTNAQMGVIANILVGIVGSFLGFWVAGLLAIAPTGGILRFVIALVGAVALIFILRALGIFKKT